jgi:hypothetical protein
VTPGEFRQRATSLSLWADQVEGRHLNGRMLSPMAKELRKGAAALREAADQVEELRTALREADAAAEAEHEQRIVEFYGLSKG